MLRTFRGVPLLGTSSAGQPGYARHCFREAVQENCKVLVPMLRVGTDRIGRSAFFEVEPTLLQHVTSPMDAERPTMRCDAERRNEGEITTLQLS